MKEDAKNRMIIFGLLSSSTALFFGYEVGIFNSFFQVFVERVFGVTDTAVQLQMKGTVSFLFLFGGTLCSLTGGFMYTKLGLYNTLIAMILIDIGTCFLFITRSMFCIYLARVVGGYFACMAGLLPSLLIKRHLPEKEANTILPSVYICVTSGLLLSFWLCVPSNIDRWGFVLMFPLIFLVPLLIIVLVFFPERSLEVPRPKQEESLEAVELGNVSPSRVTPVDPLNSSLNMQLIKVPFPSNTPPEQSLSDMFGPEYKNQMYFAIFLNVVNQLTGINFLVFYSTDIFEKVRLPNAPFLTVLVGFANFLGGVILTFCLGRFRKRDVMLWGIAGQGGFMYLVVLGLLFNSGVLVLVGCYGFVFSYAVSLGGELGPYVVDFVPAVGFAMTGLSQWICASLIGKFAINVMNLLGHPLCFTVLGTIGAFATWVFIKYSVVTEGKTPEKIKNEFIEKAFVG